MRRCPMCNSSRVTNSHRKGLWENVVLPLMARRPFGCPECHHRFYGFSFGKRTLKRMGLVLLMLLLTMSAAWGIRKVIEAVVTDVTRPTPSKPGGPARRR